MASDRDRVVAAEAERKVQAYLAEVRQFGATDLPPIDAYRASAPSLEAAYASFEQLVELRRQDAAALQSQLEWYDTLGQGLGMIVGLAICAAILTFVFAGEQMVMRPARQLHSAISQYHQGDKSSRAAVQGMAEYRAIGSVFNSMADRLGENRKTQVGFLAAIAHDLKNPLSAIKMSADLLVDQGDIPAEQRRQLLDVISRQATRLDRIVGDLLDMSRIEAGHFEIRSATVDLCQIVADTVKIYQAASHRHAITVATPPAPVLAQCDGDRITQVLNNLVSNAVKYSPQGGQIHLSLNLGSDGIRISVVDQGIGIDASDLGRIFEPFQRAASVKHDIPGVGLGLAASRKIVEAHGGRIEVRSKAGSGSEFSVVLPAQGVKLPTTMPEPRRPELGAAVPV